MREGGRERGREGGWISIWIWGAILRLTGRLGWGSMAFPTTLHIGQPCHMMHSLAFAGPPRPSPREVVALGRGGAP